MVAGWDASHRSDADITVNMKTKDVSKASPPAAAIDTETNDSSNTNKHSRNAS
jgi:hypothetical protein